MFSKLGLFMSGTSFDAMIPHDNSYNSAKADLSEKC